MKSSLLIVLVTVALLHISDNIFRRCYFLFFLNQFSFFLFYFLSPGFTGFSQLSPLYTHLQLFICFSAATMWSTCVWVCSTQHASPVNLGYQRRSLMNPASSKEFITQQSINVEDDFSVSLWHQYTLSLLCATFDLMFDYRGIQIQRIKQDRRLQKPRILICLRLWI